MTSYFFIFYFIFLPPFASFRLIYLFIYLFIFTDIPFPTPLKSIPKVEDLNNLAINVFGFEEDVFPLYLSSRDGVPINLLLICKVIDGETRSHYVWIKDINRLLYDQTKHKARKHFCLRCLFSFNSEESLSKHTPECKRIASNEPARVVLPADPSLKFVNHARRQSLPYIVYSDAECIVSPLEHDGGNTVRESKHIPCSLGFIVVRCDGKKMKEFFYRGADCVEKYFEALSRVSD